MKNTPIVAILLLSCGLSLSATEPVANPTAQAKAAMLDAVDSRWQTQATPLVERPSLRVSPSADFVLEGLTFVHSPLSLVLESITTQLNEQRDLSMSYLVMGAADPEVTLSVQKILLSDALDLLAESTAMTYERRASMLIFRPIGLEGALRTQAFPLSSSLVTRLVGSESIKLAPQNNGYGEAKTLSHYDRGASESALKSFFERIGIVWKEGTGMVIADGELLVTHNTATLKRIEDLVGRLVAHRQVQIEARFLEVEEGALDEIGVQWNISNQSGNKTGGTTDLNTSTNNTLRNLSETFSSASTSSTGTTAPTIPGSVNLAGSTSSLVDVTGVLDGVSVRGILRALSQQDGSELLSAPRVTVLSGSTANITVAQEMRYPQSYDRVNTDVGSGTTSGSIITAPTPLDFTTRNVGVEMEVTPYVEEDGSITLMLEPKVTKFERFIDYGGQSVVINGDTTETLPSGFFQPVFSVRKLTTEVNLPSGTTVILGGLTHEQSVTTSDKVPLLGDIPLLGRAFRSEGTSVQKKNLVIFVTASLIEPDVQ